MVCTNGRTVGVIKKVKWVQYFWDTPYIGMFLPFPGKVCHNCLLYFVFTATYYGMVAYSVLQMAMRVIS